MVKEYTTDVLVIGSGGAGLRAAIEADALGADVIIVSKSPTGMKSASVVTNGWFRAAVGGVTTEEHYKATMAGGKDINDTALVHGHPIQMVSDFKGLAPALDVALVILGNTLATNDQNYDASDLRFPPLSIG